MATRLECVVGDVDYDGLALTSATPSLRSRVDGYLLTILQQRTFRAPDFFETRRGGVRLMPSLT